MKKTPSLRRRQETVRDVLLDGLAGWVMSVGIILAFDQLFRFHAGVIAVALHPLLVIGVLMLFHKRMWLLPVILTAGFCLTAAVMSATGGLDGAIEYLDGFFRWWATLFPRRSPFNTQENILLAQWLIHIGIACVLYAAVRLTHSVALIASAAGLLFAVIMLNGFHRNIAAIAWVIAGMLPLLARNFHPRRADWFHPTALSPRRTVQAAGAAVCAVLCLTGALLLPKNTSGWKWKPIANAAADLSALLKLNRIDNELFRPVTLRSLGLQPNADRLGGDISLDNYTAVLRVKTNAPTLMKGRVYDTYTGKGWDAEEADAYRFGSDLFANEYNRAFDIGKPNSSSGLLKWQSLMTPADTQVTLLQRSSSLYGCGKVTALELLDSKNEPPLFNDRSELFVRATLPGKTRYRFQADWLDRDAPGFTDRFTELELEAQETADLEYPSLQYRYTRYPGALSPRVAELAGSVTAGAETAYEKTVRLESYLKNNFTYTLSPGSVPPGRDFVEYFLETKRGYCVYFASAMTVMARTVGIPARFVVGYGLGTREGDSWIAMQKNAHAWAECYFYGIGWVAFDPTAGSGYTQPRDNAAETPVYPPGGDDTPPQGGAPATTAPPPPASNPPAVTTAPKAPASPPVTPPPPFKLNIGLATALAAALGAMLILLWLLLRVQRFRTAYRLDTVRQRLDSPDKQAAWYYRDVMRQLAILGVELQGGETPLHYLRRLGETPLEKDGATETAPDLSPVFSRIVEWRYGEVPLTPEHIAGMAAVHEELEPLVRRQMKPWQYVWNRILRHKS